MGENGDTRERGECERCMSVYQIHTYIPVCLFVRRCTVRNGENHAKMRIKVRQFPCSFFRYFVGSIGSIVVVVVVVGGGWIARGG